MWTLARLLVLLAASLAVMLAQTARFWQVKLPDGTKATLAADNSGQLEIKDRGSVLFTIPTASIQEILYTSERQRRSTRTWDYFENRCCGGTNSHLLGAIAAAVAAPAGSAKSHYAEIHWFEKAPHVLALELAKDEYRPFLDWLQQLSGVQVSDVEQEREKLRKSMEQFGQHVFHADISYSEKDGVVRRRYSVLPADDNEDTQLYFFLGDLRAKNIVGIYPARRRWSINKCVFDAQVLYGKCSPDHCGLAAIMLPTVTYWLETEQADVTDHSAPESDMSCSQLAKQKAEGIRALGDLRRATRPAEPPKPN